MIPEARQAVFTAKVKGSRQTRQPADVQAASHRLIVCVAVRRGYQTQDHAPGAAEDVHLSHGERAVLSWFPGTAWLEAALLVCSTSFVASADASGEREEGVQPPALLQDLHHGQTASEHRRAEGHDRVLHRPHHKNGGDVPGAGKSPSDSQKPRNVGLSGQISKQDVCLLQKNTVKTLFGGVITNNVVSLVSARTFSLLSLVKSTMTLWWTISTLSQRGHRPRRVDRGGEVHHEAVLCCPAGL